jgi:hypothetical protein
MRKVLLAAVVAVGLGLTGCVAFVLGSPSAAQTATLGSVRISATICASDNGADQHVGCDVADVTGGDANGNSNDDAQGDNSVQVLLGYRVPAGSSGPVTFPGTSEAGTLTMSQSASYTAELQRLAPAPAGQHWVGYISNAFAYNPTTDGTNADHHRVAFAVDFDLPRSADGGPFTGPFPWQMVAGMRANQFGGGVDPARAVDCGASLTALTADDTICADQPAPGDIAAQPTVPTRDLGILTGAPVDAAQSKDTTVPFTARYRGTASGEPFSVTATTTIPGATVTPTTTSFTPADNADTPLGVKLRVPKSASTGNFDVTLSARLANGQVRTNTASVRVVDKTKPTTKITIPKGQTVASVLKRGLKLRVHMSEAARVTDELRLSPSYLSRSLRAARKVTTFKKAGTKTVRLKIVKKLRKKSAKAKLLDHKRVKIVLRQSAKDGSGNRSKRSSKTIKLKSR